jgi:hypothetical protein
LRIRALKPGFFKNEQLAELSPWHRLCFEGLWCYADRDGRLRDRPKRIKAEVFPYDDVNFDALLWDLTRAGLIRRYVIGSQPLIDIPTWHAHQRPRPDEAESELPPYASGTDRTSPVDATTCPIATPTVTDPSLSSVGSVTPARMGKGYLDLGSGDLEGGSAADAALSPEATRGVRAQDLIDLWNATTKPPLPRCRELTDDRRRKIRARLAKRPALADWREAFEAIQAGAFYRGQNDRGWVADFDWIVKNDTVAAKVLERAQTAKPGAPRRLEPTHYATWECPHKPTCAARGACHSKSEIERFRAAERVGA